MSDHVLNCLGIFKVYVTTLNLKKAKPVIEVARLALLIAVLLNFATPQASCLHETFLSLSLN